MGSAAPSCRRHNQQLQGVPSGPSQAKSSAVLQGTMYKALAVLPVESGTCELNLTRCQARMNGRYFTIATYDERTLLELLAKLMLPHCRQAVGEVGFTAVDSAVYSGVIRRNQQDYH